jgi:hypothetical protein
LLYCTDGSRPESSGGITLSIVEAVLRLFVGFGIRDGLFFPGSRIEKGEAVVSSDQVTSLSARDDETDPFSHFEGSFLPVRRIEGIHAMSLDVDIVQDSIVPDRTFAPLGELLSCYGNHAGTFGETTGESRTGDPPCEIREDSEPLLEIIFISSRNRFFKAS